MHNKASENRRFGEDSSSFQPIGAGSRSAETVAANACVATFPKFTPWYSLHYRSLWINTEQLQPKQFLPTFAVNHPSQKTQVQLGAENISLIWLQELSTWGSWKGHQLLYRTGCVVSFQSDLPLHHLFGKCHKRPHTIQSGKIFNTFIDVAMKKILVDASFPQQLLP